MQGPGQVCHLRGAPVDPLAGPATAVIDTGCNVQASEGVNTGGTDRRLQLKYSIVAFELSAESLAPCHSSWCPESLLTVA